MHELLIIALSFLLGLFSGFIAALSSGGGLISIPGLIFLGLSPASAIATSRLDALSSDLAALFRYRKEGIIKWLQTIPLVLIAIIGGFLGSKFLLQINEVSLEKVVGILLLLLAPILVFDKDFGVVIKKKNKKHHFTGFAAIFLVALYSAMFGGGGGIFMIYALIYFYGLSIIQANANGKVLGLFATLAALVTFTVEGVIDFAIGIPLLLGGVGGGYLGANTAIKKGNELIKFVLLIIILISGIKLTLF